MGKFTIYYLKSKYKTNTNKKKKQKQKKNLKIEKTVGVNQSFPPSLPPVFLLNSFLYH